MDPDHSPTWRSVEVEAGAVEAVTAWCNEPTDVLEQARLRRSVRAVLEENARLRSVLGHCPKGVAVLDEDGRLRGYNRELRNLLQIAPELGAPIAEYFDPTDRDMLREVVRSAGTTRSAAAVLRTHSTDDSQRDVEFLAATLPSSSTDRSIGVVLAGDDRTATLHDEWTRETISSANRSAAYSVARAVAHHELQSMLAPAMLAIDALRASARHHHRLDEPGIAELLEQASTALRQQASMLERMGRDRLSATPGSASSVAIAARKAARLAWIGPARRRVMVQVDVDDAMRARLAESELVQVLTNVVANGVHAVEETGRLGWVSVTARALEERREVEVRVRDNGVGIEPARLKACFEAYETSRAEVGGRGLGLAIAKQLVESVGGNIRALSEPGTGAEFVITLPAA